MVLCPARYVEGNKMKYRKNEILLGNKKKTKGRCSQDLPI